MPGLPSYHFCIVPLACFFISRKMILHFPFLERNDLTIIAHSLVISRLGYCNLLHVSLPLMEVTTSMRQLGWCQEQQVRWYHSNSRLTYNALYGLEPWYLMDHVSPIFPNSCPTLYQRGPSVSHEAREAQLLGTGVRLFSLVAPLLWNSLPGDSCLAPCLETFWHHAKIEMARHAFNEFWCSLPYF